MGPKGFQMVKNIMVDHFGTFWTTLEHWQALKFDFRQGANKSGHLDTGCKVVAKYILIYFHILYEKLGSNKLDQKQKYLR